MHHFDGESEVQEAQKQRVELVEPRVDAPAALETSEQPLDLVPQLVEFAVAVPFDFPVHTVKAAAPHESKQKDWMETIKGQLNAGRVDGVIADLKPHRRLEEVAPCIRTYGTNKDRMRCDLCRKRGLPVGSGVVESACRQIAGSRFKGAGYRWSKAGANALLAVKCCFRNNRRPDFLNWRACSAAAA